MSRESLAWLNTNVLVGFTDKRGTAWHYRASDQGDESNHYPGPIPVDDVLRRLFKWHAVESDVTATAITEHGVLVVEDKDHKAIVRPDTGTVLGVFSKKYVMHQFDEWLLETVAQILDDDLSIGSAGLLKGGAVGWVSVEVPDNIVTPEGVEFRPNLMASTSFDGSLATIYKRIVTNVVCDNTMAAGLRERGQEFRAKHTRNSGMRLRDAREALEIIHTTADDFMAEVAELTNTSVSNDEFDKFLAEITPIPKDEGRAQTMAINKATTLRRMWDHDTRVTPWRNTAWGIVQLVNTYTHHEGIVRGMDRTERNMLRAVQGGVDKLDASTLQSLEAVIASPC